MSSFIGHGLIAITAFKYGDKENNGRSGFIWLSWLILCALLPDIDYLFTALQSTNNNGIRITHSIALSLILPIITIIFILFKNGWKDIKVSSIQVTTAGLSHLILDMMVGVTPVPLLFPLSNMAIKPPLGILPSAGGLNISNYYFYRNLIIELGILSPICYLLLILRNGVSEINKFRITILLTIFLCCLIWSLNLNR